jgi:TatD DNase family protein
MFIDTHAHLNMDAFDEDLNEVIRNARKAGVEAIIDIGTDLPTSQKSIQISLTNDMVFASVGIHPHDAVKTEESDFVELEHLAGQSKVVAIGETGLDYHYDFSPPDDQKHVFKIQLLLARKLHLPLIIHNRQAFQDGLDILDDAGNSPWKGVFHCFGGSAEEAHKILERGFHISFTGVVTFKNFTKRDVVRTVPLEKILLETDAPYMTPVPHRGKRNEPKWLIHTAQVLAGIYEIDLNRLLEITTANARSLFGMGAD